MLIKTIYDFEYELFLNNPSIEIYIVLRRTYESN